ncbi:replication initiation protein [Streptomyces sp. NBC_01476]|uniref:replication initiator n=1 Tax=Streptomyces sp. NBC_01476 TaxID=2903881 RepID=UPI002E326307|nr:replication initiator [Streptomyces sp. NBC_01476]
MPTNPQPELESLPQSLPVIFAPGDLEKLAVGGQLPVLVRLLTTLGGCARPIRLDGYRTKVDTATGLILRHLDSREMPAGCLLVCCGNRRTTGCPSCAEIYRHDTYQLIAAGLRGGKTVPTTITTHPRVFATFTAPSFGPVHNRPSGETKRDRRCRCGRTHSEGDPLLGSPLDPDRYDYRGAVLGNAHAPALWSRFMLHLRRAIARAAGLTQRSLSSAAKISYAKVAEYQRRGLVHFHAVIRLDGPDGSATPPPAWATTELLGDAIQTAATRTRVAGPEMDGGTWSFAFGTQLDVRPIRSGDFTGGTPVTERAVAASIAKYATKGAEGATGTLDRRLRLIGELHAFDIPPHAERMIRTAWELGARRDLADLKLRSWAHMLGFRGHFSTKTRQYSTTLAELRQARADYQHTQTGAPTTVPEQESTLTLAHWAFSGIGPTPELARLASALTPPPGPRAPAATHG